jgi:hypothetical protein
MDWSGSIVEKILENREVGTALRVSFGVSRPDGIFGKDRWRTFLRNHAPDIAAMDLLIVPTIGFDLLYAFVIIRLDRRDLVWINVTTNPTAEWIARQITEAFPWDDAPQHLIRDRDRIYGTIVTRRLRAMGMAQLNGSRACAECL